MKRQHRYHPAANDLLVFARAARRLATRYPEHVEESDVLLHIDALAANVGMVLLDMVLDHEEREARLVAMWRKWRRGHRSRTKVGRKSR